MASRIQLFLFRVKNELGQTCVLVWKYPLGPLKQSVDKEECPLASPTATLNQTRVGGLAFPSPGHIKQCLETFLIVIFLEESAGAGTGGSAERPTMP